jgi:hypothetical protein
LFFLRGVRLAGVAFGIKKQVLVEREGTEVSVETLTNLGIWGWDMSMEPVQTSHLEIGGNTTRQRIVGHKNLISLLQITGRFVLV